ncbi:MAG: hypothetical protein ACE5EH_12250 [Gammaproteobacteria bacterium]
MSGHSIKKEDVSRTVIDKVNVGFDIYRITNSLEQNWSAKLLQCSEPKGSGETANLVAFQCDPKGRDRVTPDVPGKNRYMVSLRHENKWFFVCMN